MARLLTADEASRGIYIDFEGRIDQAPVLLGILTPDGAAPGTTEQMVLDPRLEPAAIAASLRVVTIESVIEDLVGRFEVEGRALIGWSRHEVDVVERECSAELAQRFAECYADAKQVATVAQRRPGLPLRPLGRPHETTPK